MGGYRSCGGFWEREPHGGCGLSAQALTTFQRSLTTMQIQVGGLLQFAVPLFPTAEVGGRAAHSARAGRGEGSPGGPPPFPATLPPSALALPPCPGSSQGPWARLPRAGVCEPAPTLSLPPPSACFRRTSWESSSC